MKTVIKGQLSQWRWDPTGTSAAQLFINYSKKAISKGTNGMIQKSSKLQVNWEKSISHSWHSGWTRKRQTEFCIEKCRQEKASYTIPTYYSSTLAITIRGCIMDTLWVKSQKNVTSLLRSNQKCLAPDRNCEGTERGQNKLFPSCCCTAAGSAQLHHSAQVWHHGLPPHH